jgi:hypothetical protein
MNNLKLVDPTSDLVVEFRAMAEEWREAGETKFDDASDSVASARIIEKNGGQVLGHSISDRTGKQVSRYRLRMAEQQRA